MMNPVWSDKVAGGSREGHCDVEVMSSTLLTDKITSYN